MTDAGFTVYPAIDVRGGRVVRLAQGDYDRQTDYGGDPLAIADAYARAGAEWLHLVDLDAAKSGGYTLGPLLQGIVVATGLKVQTGGGVRSRDDVVAILDAGAARVVVGSLAVRDPTLVQGWIEEFGPDSITVALDARQAADGEWRLPTHGWTEASGARLDGLAEAYAGSGLVHLLSTDIEKDGMLSGPNLGLYRYLRQIAPTLQVQASGGVRGLDDVAAAKAGGCAGVVLGRALLEGRLDLAEALAC